MNMIKDLQKMLINWNVIESCKNDKFKNVSQEIGKEEWLIHFKKLYYAKSQEINTHGIEVAINL